MLESPNDIAQALLEFFGGINSEKESRSLERFQKRKQMLSMLSPIINDSHAQLARHFSQNQCFEALENLGMDKSL